jgi:hypothetical protein
MAAGATYEPIATTTLGTAAVSVTFSSISQAYTDLVLIVNAKGASGGDKALAVRFNGDTGTNYSQTRISGNGTTADSDSQPNEPFMDLGLSNSTVYNSDIYQIMNYSNTTTYKTALGRGNLADSRLRAGVGVWRNTAAITSVTVINGGSINFIVGSTFTLYGIKAA